MKLKPQNTYKHLLNFVSTSMTRPVLQGFHFLPNGKVEATDGHKFLRLLTNSGINEEYVLDPKTLFKIDGDYPKVDHLLNSFFKKTGTVSQVESIALCNFLKGASKNEIATVTIGQNMTINLKNGASTIINIKFTGDELVIVNVNATFLKQIFEFIKDFTDEDVLIGVISDRKQITFKKEGSFVAMLFPVMTAKGE